jgi:hypothetical protein
MWRWVTRGLASGSLVLLLTPALHAQGFIGSLDSPDPNQVQTGEIFVRGFVLDPALVQHVDLFVDGTFLSSALTDQPRIDVVEAFPNYPGIHSVKPGFVTGFLASRFSNGPHALFVRVFLSDGEVVDVGNRTINIDNSVNQPPFGSVDIPGSDATYDAQGSFPVVGWATDTDGIKIVEVKVDGQTLQSAILGDERPDVSNAFPDLPQALFSGFIANIDTTRLTDGIHTLTVEATDLLGLPRVIGRRVIQVFNSGINLKPFGRIDSPQPNAVLFGTNCATIPPPIVSPVGTPTNAGSHLSQISGWALDLGTRTDLGRVSYVELLIDGVRWNSTDNCSFDATFNTFINCYGMPRFDVERFYPNYPDSPRSGYMFTLDVGALLALGVPPGNHTLKVRVGDQAGTFSEIPGPQGIPVFFTCANAITNFDSFGFIDLPTPFEFTKGTIFFQGWALDSNGVTEVELSIDGDFIGVAQYGSVRTDVQQAFPTVPNSIHSGWSFAFDSTPLSNARHRLTVTVLDAGGNRTVIGSTDFFIDNPRP